MIPIANAQNEFKSLLDSKSLRVVHTENQRWEMHGKLKMALYILIQQQKKTIKGGFSYR
jgi:hypothetical protein